MNRTDKRIIFFTLSVIIVIVIVVAGVRYFPMSKIVRIGSSPEMEYTNQEQIRSHAPNTLFYDFEVDSKHENDNGLYKGVAHSGNFSTRVFGKNTYSIAINRTAGEIGLDNLDAVGMSCWIYIFPTSNEINGALVFTINNDLGVNICWKGIPVSGNDLPLGKWFKITGIFDLSEFKLKENFKIQVYFWNNSSTDILADDFYIVFGGQKQRKGDSAFVDMTKGIAFHPRFNFPPYPVNWLEKQEVKNQNSTFLIKAGDLRVGEISPLDNVYKGNFLANTDGKEDLLVIKPAGGIELYHFCTDKTKFIRIKTTIPADLLPKFKSGRFITGRYTGIGTTQLLVITETDLLLGAFDPGKDVCSSGKDNKSAFNVIWKVPLPKAKTLGFKTGVELLSDDFDGDKISELITIGKNGSWVLLKLDNSQTNPIRVIASGKEKSVQEWQLINPAFKVTSGRFLNNYDQDLILTIFKPEKSRGFSYSLHRFDAVNRQFVPLFPEKQQYSGKTIGLDTLHPDDEFFTGPFDNSGRIKILRYNREWRFDLKEIKFDDSTYQVIANMDFKGYEKDFNPKYFDVLRIIPGIFLNPGTESLLVIGRNCKTRDTLTNKCSAFQDLPFLPNTLQFYSYPNQKK